LSWESLDVCHSGLSSSEPVSIAVKNVGIISQNNFILKYSIDSGNTWIADTITSVLNSGDTLIHTFSTSANLSADGQYVCKAVVVLLNDSNSINDTITKYIDKSLQLSIGSDTLIDFGDSIQLLLTHNVCGAVTYLWSPSSGLSSSSIQSPIASPLETTKYYVSIMDGTNTYTDSITIYVNMFTEISSANLDGIYGGATDWGDYDNDGDLDIIITGSYYDNSTFSDVPSTKVYRNDGNNIFTYQAGINIVDLSESDVAWGDYDNDGWLDIIISGNTYATAGYVTKVYKNSGNQNNQVLTFSEQSNISIIGVHYSSLDWGDYDNDGDLDILICGATNSGDVSKIYRNEKDSFIEQTSISLYGISEGTAKWGDYNNDGFLDILLGDYYNTFTYRNNGDNSFMIDSVYFVGATGEGAWGDYDSDGDLDLIITGSSYGGSANSIYKNNGLSNGWSFTEQTSIPLMSLGLSSVKWGDINNDGNLDIIVTGASNGIEYLIIYKNNGDNTFTELDNISIDGINQGDFNLSDYDNDGDLDILVSGYNQNSYSQITKLYRNNTVSSNISPSIVSGLQSIINNDTIHFTWNSSNDSNTHKNSLTYNMSMGNSSNLNSIISAQSDLNNGLRKIVDMGNMQLDTVYKMSLFDLKVGDTVIWAVQALDNCFQGSAFSNTDSVIIPLYVEIERTDTVSICPQSFALNAINNYDSIGGNDLTYEWTPTIGLSDSTIKNPIAHNVGPITYHLTVTSPEGWTATDSFYVYMDSIPTADFILPSQSTVNDTVDIIFSGTGTSNAVYNWDMDSAYIISGASQGPYEVSWDSTGIRDISLSVSEYGCVSQIISQSISILSSGSIIIADSVCKGSNLIVSYVGSADSNAIYSWNFDGGIINSGSGKGPYQVEWDTIGIKYISLIIVENGIISNPFTDSTRVDDNPVFTVTSGQTICLFESVTLSASVVSAQYPLSYFWSNSDTNPATTVTPSNDSIFYLNITDAHGCSSVDSSFINVNVPYDQEEICLVSIDSATEKNIVVWERTPNKKTDYYIIYKESTITNIYDSIGFRPYDSLSYFIDYNSYPKVKSAKYRISVVDSCGNESNMSDAHRTIMLLINKQVGWSFGLNWNFYEGFSVQTYRIWRWDETDGWSLFDSVAGSQDSRIDPNPPTGLVKYFVEVVSPHPCNISKANTNYNTSRSNTTSTLVFMGMRNAMDDANVSISPNPNNGKFTLEINTINNRTQNYNLEIYNTVGELIHSEKLELNNHLRKQMNFDKLSKGVYFIKLRSKDNLLNTRFIIQ